MNPCPNCGAQMRCIKNEVTVLFDRQSIPEVRYGDLYECDCGNMTVKGMGKPMHIEIKESA